MGSKTKLLTVTSIALLSITLSSCGVTAIEDKGNILTFGNGEHVTANELLENYQTSQVGIEAYYNAINDVVARYIMTNDSEIKNNGRYQELVDRAEVQVEDTKQEAEDNARTNGTNYEDELDTLLSSEGVEDLEGLQTKYENQLFKDYLQDKFYDDHMDNLLTGGSISVGNETIEVESYLNDTLPYHVKHILLNVEGSSSEYARGTLTATQAKTIYSLIRDLTFLGEGDNFGTLAKTYSQDTGSASTYGDLGIMSKNTSYVNEFKLGIYTYDSLFNTSISDEEKAKLELTTAEDLSDEKEFLSQENQGISFIPYEAAQILNEYAEDEKDDSGELVNGGNTAYYPRNIIFNQYFNRHEISFITPEKVDGGNLDGLTETDGLFYINNQKTSFKRINFGQEIGEKVVLCDEQGIPVMVTRAGTSSSSSTEEGSSGYEGIHFIVVQRSALDPKGINDTTLEEYYSTEMPDANGLINGKVVYVNAFVDDRSVYQQRINTLEDDIKQADPSISRKINQYWFIRSGAKIVNETVANKIDQYIIANEVGNKINDEIEYYDTWNTYYNMLNRQINERRRLVPMTCYVNFRNASNLDGDGDLFGKGGECYYVQA